MNIQMKLTNEMLSVIKNYYEKNSIINEALASMVENHEINERLQVLKDNSNTANKLPEYASKRAALYEKTVQIFYLFKEAHSDSFSPEQIFETELLYFLATHIDAGGGDAVSTAIGPAHLAAAKAPHKPRH